MKDLILEILIKEAAAEKLLEEAELLKIAAFGGLRGWLISRELQRYKKIMGSEMI
jgi:hypothetical protein